MKFSLLQIPSVGNMGLVPSAFNLNIKTNLRKIHSRFTVSCRLVFSAS
jgi:hypothetical protein